MTLKVFGVQLQDVHGPVDLIEVFNMNFLPRKSMTWAGRPKVSWHWTTIYIYIEREKVFKTSVLGFCLRPGWLNASSTFTHARKQTHQWTTLRSNTQSWVNHLLCAGRPDHEQKLPSCWETAWRGIRLSHCSLSSGSLWARGASRLSIIITVIILTTVIIIIIPQ